MQFIFFLRRNTAAPKLVLQKEVPLLGAVEKTSESLVSEVNSEARPRKEEKRAMRLAQGDFFCYGSYFLQDTHQKETLYFTYISYCSGYYFTSTATGVVDGNDMAKNSVFGG